MPKRPIYYKDFGYDSKNRAKKVFNQELISCLSENTLKFEVFYNDGNHSGNIQNQEKLHDTDDELFELNSITATNTNEIPTQTEQILKNTHEEEYDLFGSDAESCCDSENEDSDEEDTALGDELYPGSSMSVREFILCVGLLKSNLKQADAHTCRTLKLFSLVLPKPNKCPTTYYKFKKYLDQMEHSVIKKHFYCPDCVSLSHNCGNDTNTDESIEEEEISDENEHCECNSKQNYFIEIPLIEQLESLYKRPHFYEKLQHKNIIPRNQDNYNDIYSGSIYKELAEHNQILSDSRNISFMWYTDGVSIFRSSKFSIWGFFLVILDLPYEDRYKLENVLLVSLWFGDKKPAPNLFLEPIKESLKLLYRGVNFYVRDINRTITVKGIVMCGTADLPAKALFLAMNQYNGRFGCQMCITEGRTVDRRRTYPFNNNIILRTEEDVEVCMMEALDIGQPVCGVKGPTIISKFCHKFISSTAIDAMHCVFGGVSKRLRELMFDTQFSEENFSISHLIDIADHRLSQIKPPSFVARLPRSIKIDSSYWKISEEKIWFFYFSPLVLNGLLPEEYFEHYMYLIQAIYILCKETISNEELNLAESLIEEFVSRFAYLYGDKMMSCNVHCLLHLAEVVRRLGPLWTTSCFPLEDVNGKIKAFVHGSRKPELQIVFNLSMHVKIHTFKFDWLQQDTDAYYFYEHFLGKQKRMKLTDIGNNIYVVGTSTKVPDIEAEQTLRIYNLQGSTLFSFRKIYKNKMVYTSKAAQGGQKTESFFVSYVDDQSNLSFGIIQNYIRVTNCTCKKMCKCLGENYACLNKIFTVNPISLNVLPGGVVEFIHECIRINNSMEMVNVDNLNNVCYHVQFDDKSYLCLPVNKLEFE